MGIVHFLAMFWIERRDDLKDGLIGRENPMIACHGCRKDIVADSMALVV
jgi:hypothetical protein